MLIGKTAVPGPKGIKKGDHHEDNAGHEVERGQWWQFAVADDKVQAELEA
jgi:DNA-directed RNA polymerase subunit beta